MKTILYLFLLICAVPVFAQSNIESEITNIVNISRYNHKYDALSINSKFYKTFDKAIAKIKTPADTTINEIEKVLKEIRLHLDTSYPWQDFVTNYAVVVTTNQELDPLAVVMKMIKSVDDAVTRIPQLNTLVPKYWEYSVNNKKIIFIYLVGFE